MRIVVLNPIGGLGGAEQSLLDVLAELDPEEFVPHLIVGTDGPLLDAARALGATPHQLPMPPALAALGDSALVGGRQRLAWVLRAGRAALGTLEYVRRLRRLVRRLAPTVIHANGLKCDILSGLLPADLGPVLWYVHDFVGTRPVAAALLRRAARRVSLALANSRAVAADLGKALPGVPVEVVYYGIDAERFAPGPGAGPWLDDLAGLPAAAPGTVRVGLVATYARWKGHDVFLRAAGEVIREVAAPVRFYVVGGPIYHTAGSQYTRAELADLAAAAGLAGRIGFVPFQKDTPAVYRSLDVVVHASTRPEPFGRTIVEAMACGGAVILARAGGAAEIGTPGADLLATPPGDVAALTHALAILIRQPELRARLGERGRQTVLARFSRARLGREMRAVYRRLSGRPR